MGYLYISYSRQNAETAQRLVQDLQERGYTVWIDTEDLAPGTRWFSQVDAAIHNAEVFIVLLSPAAQNRTIQNEIELAHTAGKPIIPVLVEATTIPSSLANHQIVNATGEWNAFVDRLVNAIDASTASLQIRRAEPVPPAAAPSFAPPMPMSRAPRKVSNTGLIVFSLLGIVIVIVIILSLLRPAVGNVFSNITSGLESSTTSSELPNTDVAQIQFTEIVPTLPSTITDEPTLATTPAALRTVDGNTTTDSTVTSEAPIGADSPTATHQGTEVRQSPTIRPVTRETDGPDLTITAIIDRATAQSIQNATSEAQSLSSLQLTATALESIFAGLTPTVESSDTRPTPTALPGTGGGIDIRTEIAAQVEATVVAVIATENSLLSPAEAAQISSFSSNNTGLIFIVGLVAASALGVSVTVLAMLMSGSTVQRSRPRPAHHHAGTAGQPQTVLPKMMLEDYQIFTSSSEKDKEWVRILVEDLEALGYAVWWYAKDAPGLPFGNEIRSAIYHTKVFLIVLSPDSMQSKHVEEEIRWAEIYDRPIIPVECRPTSIEERFYGLAKGSDIDFTIEIDYKQSLEFLAQAIDHHLQQRLEQFNIEDSHDSD